MLVPPVSADQFTGAAAVENACPGLAFDPDAAGVAEIDGLLGSCSTVPARGTAADLGWSRVPCRDVSWPGAAVLGAGTRV